MGSVRPLTFTPFHELAGRPNVVVDSYPTDGTVLVLSHWPGAPTPPDLAGDVSAESAFRFLAHVKAGHPQPAADLVSTNHFDEDGLVGLFAVVDPEAASTREALLVEVATAGDFAVWRHRDAARIVLAIGSFAQSERSPLDPRVFALPWSDRTGTLYRELLPRLASLCDHVDRHRGLWQAGDALLEAGLAALADGSVRVEERPDLDLAIVTVDPRWADRVAAAHEVEPAAALSDLALHPATDRLRLLVVRGSNYEVRYRYETWVQLRHRSPLPRVDLAPLAAELDAMERDGAEWSFDGVDDLTPRLALTDGDSGSSLPPERFRALVEDALTAAA